MPEPLWRGRTPDLGDCCSCPLLDNGDRFPPGTEVVVLTTEHYEAMLASSLRTSDEEFEAW